MDKKFIAYKGDLFVIEWYYDHKGNSLAFDYYNELSTQQQEKLLYLFYVLTNTGKIRNEEKFRNEGDQIYAFKPAPDRFLCFFNEGRKVIITNAYHKKTNKLPSKEKERALKFKSDFIKRYKEGNYYE